MRQVRPGKSVSAMVHIKRLEIRGFKSLGNRPATLEIDQGLMVITGPNGGGKSNVMDAITFCLGQNSPKMLRVNRLTSLIYDGGTQGQRPLSSRVTITFDNQQRSIPIDSEAVTVTRELKIDGDNTYFLNGKKVSKNTVSEVLGLALVSPEGFNIVPQGMVTRISELLSDEKRKLIEEIAGVAQFDRKKAEVLRQLQEADTRLQVALARMGEIKNRVDSLEGERNRHLRLRRLEDEIRWLRAVITSRSLADVGRRIKEQERLVKDATTGLGELQNRLSEHLTQLSSLEHERSMFISTVVDGAGGRLVELQSSTARDKHESENLNSDITHAVTLVKSIEESLPNLRQLQEKTQAEIEKYVEHISSISAKLSDLEQAKVTAEKELNAVQVQKQKLEDKLSEANEFAARLRQRVETYSNALNVVNGRIATLKERLTLALERLKSMRDKSRSFLETLGQLEEHLSELNRLKRMEEDSVKKAGESVATLSGRRMRLEEEIAKAMSVLEKADTAVLTYESQRSVAEQFIADEMGLAKLEELGKAGAVVGFVGRFDRLIRYDSRYEQAVLAAGNRWMRSIVVEDLKAMLKMVELAKRLKLGRVAIVPFSEVADSPRVTPPTGEGVIGALADVVTLQEGREGLVNFVFGDAILVRSPRVAYEVSSRGFRSVTLVGDTLEPRSTAFETGYVAKLDAIVGMIRDEASISTVKGALKSLGTIISKRKVDIKQLDKQSQQFEGERVRRNLLLERITTEMNSETKFIAKYRKLRDSIERKVEKMAKLPDRLQRQIDGLTATCSSINVKIEQCNEKIGQSNIQGLVDEIRTLDDRKALYLDQIEKISADIRETVTQRVKDQSNLEHNLNPSVNRLVNQIQQSEAELAERRRFIDEGSVRLQELTRELEVLKSEEATLLESSKKSRPLLESYEDRLKRLHEEEEKLRHGITSLEKQLFETNRNLERMVESEQRYLGELTLYGYSSPIEYFDGSEVLLQHLNVEYDEVKNRVNLLADSQYKEVFVGYKNLSLRRNQLETERNTIVGFVENIDKEKRQVFVNTFEKIDRELRLIFSKLTGGSAWLEIENPEDVFAGGVFLMTQFPGKVPRESSSVSGGEKTVSAISLILAIQSVYPSPFYLFDEVDAHLDAVNCERLVELLKERASHSQIIMISLKDSAVSKASMVYGIYMANGISQIVKYRPKLQLAVEHA